MDLAWLTGKASADHMRETRPEYYRQLMEKRLSPAETAGEGEQDGSSH